MSSVLFDAGDLQRLDREAQLTEQLPRLPLEPDRSPIEGHIQDEPENDFDLMLDALAALLQRRLE